MNIMLRNIIEALLQGQFLCQVSSPALYQELQDGDVQEKVKKTLASLGRELRHTENKEAYYCAFTDLSNPKDGRQIQSLFEQLRNQIAPVVHFLTLTMRIRNSDATLISGDTLEFHHLLSNIEAEPAYSIDLTQMGRYSLFKKAGSKSTNQDRLKVILEIMEKEGYLTLVNTQSAIYQVTGKMQYFYNCLEFIRDYEQIPLQEEADQQKDLSFDD
jgi:hypothetical protein